MYNKPGIDVRTMKYPGKIFFSIFSLRMLYIHVPNAITSLF